MKKKKYIQQRLELLTSESRLDLLLALMEEGVCDCAIPARALIDEVMGRREPECLSLLVPKLRLFSSSNFALKLSELAEEKCYCMRLPSIGELLDSSWAAEMSAPDETEEFRLINELVDEGMACGDAAFLALMRGKLQPKAARYPVEKIIRKIDDWGAQQAALAAGSGHQTDNLQKLYCMENKENEEGDFKIIVNSPGNFFAKTIRFESPVYFGCNGNLVDQFGYTDQQIAHALEAVCGEGKAVDEKRKWAAVYWCLRWYCNFPVKGADFCERVKKLPYSGVFRPDFTYENIRKLITASFMEQDAREIDSIKPEMKDKDFFAECKVVVQALAQELGKAVLQKR